ncbi:hypothetical protein GCM10027020_23840 [Nocardioides salsibiostraticola]
MEQHRRLTYRRGVRSIPDPGFSGDVGAAAAEVATALAAYGADPGLFPETLRALQAARLIVPVVAVLGEVEVDAAGLTHDKSSDMATVLLTGADGRQALLAFTSLETMAAWDAEVRPVPVTAQVAAASAVQEGAAALLIDVAGPVQVVVAGDDLTGFAEGWSLQRVGDRSAWIRPSSQ